VLFNPKVKVKAANIKTIREACPYDIPRWNEKTEGMAKCTMCIDRIKEGLLPACVKSCPTGTMNFGDRKAMLEMANKRLVEVKDLYKEATLANVDDIRAIFLLVDDPKKYHKFAVAENTIGITRKMALKRLFQPLRSLSRMIG
jgi:formate dehydrogenase iron-sulfur subunit